MAQLVLSAATSAISAVGRAGVGAILARTVASTAAAYAAGFAERLIFGPKKRTVEGPRLESFQVQASTEGAGIPRVYGRARLSGQIIWAANFKETLAETVEQSGGKGGRLSATKTTVKEYLYSISFAVGLCEGPIARIGRVWADGKPFDMSRVNVRVHPGTEDQAPDDLINAIEGGVSEGGAPAFRGLAYVVFEDLPLKDFGNRIPQLSFEIEKPLSENDAAALENALTAVTIIPGSGEFAYGTTRVIREAGEGVSVAENASNNDGVTDFSASLAGLQTAAPNLSAASLVVAWFGDDLRAGHCTLRPGVDRAEKATSPYEWRAGGVTRAGARLVSSVEGRPAYGGTPADRAVIEAIRAMTAQGLAVMLHPFILMDIPPGNGLPAPEGGGTQGAYPWRGRIKAATSADIAAFFGTAAPAHFTRAGDEISYSGPNEWSFRRMILHMAHLCAAAGGVEAFLIGSELKALLAFRDGAGNFSAVAAMRALAADVRAILGAGVKISYGADWSEWSGVSGAGGEKHFHLDPLWADGNIDFIGVDYYPPLADWRDGFSHADLLAGWKGQHERAYISANIEGGENFDWHYASAADRAAQSRTAITDGAHGEPFIWRAKDIRGFWENAHHDRPGGVRNAAPTPWVPRSKPIRLTELGAPAVDKAANGPNAFIDPKSAETALPPFSSGARDDLAQRRALEAVIAHWKDPANNPSTGLYGGRMVEADRLYVYAWDARPFPFFPARADLWGDAPNWERGHWLNGRLTRAPLDALVGALCGAVAHDATALKGSLAGYVLDRPLSPREAIEPLADLFQFDVVETESALSFRPRGLANVLTLSVSGLVEEEGGLFTLTTGEAGDVPTALRLGFIDEGGDYEAAMVEARAPFASPAGAARETAIELPAVMDEAGAIARARSILADANVMRETARFSLPPSLASLEPGDAVRFELAGAARDFRILSIEDGAARRVEAVRVAPAVYDAPGPSGGFRVPQSLPQFGAPAVALMNLPLLSEDDDGAAPYFAAFADPWPGAIALYRQASAPVLAATATARAVMGRLEAALAPAPSGRWTKGTIRVRIGFGALASRSAEEILAGANAAAIETAEGFEIVQFRDADLQGDGSWLLSGLLRGQRGTEAPALAGAPIGARFVLLTGALVGAGLPADLAGVAFDWSAGPADDLPASETFRTVSFTGEAKGLKPLSPVHVRARANAGGLDLSWVRRTRQGGDSWAGEDVPLAEASERYRLEIRRASDDALIRTAETTAPLFAYTAALIATDFPPATYPAGRPPLLFRVAQLSEAVGAGDWGEGVA